jgi:uncharacterized protein (DUF433 family)
MALSNNVIIRDPDVLGGTPVFRGTRVPFQALLDYLEGGQTLDEFLDDFPSVTRDAAVHALECAKARAVDDTHLAEAVNLGLAAAERGDFVKHEEVGKKVKQILRP